MANPYKHIFITQNVIKENYKAQSKPGGKPNIPERERVAHSTKLLQQFDAIWKEKARLQQSRSAEQVATREGTYVCFTSAANYDLVTKSLEDIRKGIRLLNIKELNINEGPKQVRATVYIPNGLEGFFIKKIASYQDEAISSPTGKPKNAPLVNSIEDVSIALLEGLWTDNLQLIPTDTAKWCEVWLNVNTREQKEQEQIALFISTLSNIGIEHKRNAILFPERAVLLINANHEQLIALMLQSDLLAEFRAGQQPAGFWVNESAAEQQDWLNDLLHRIDITDSNVKVCVLDSGINNGHQLLQPLIDSYNSLTYHPDWGTNDHEPSSGHGTLMAGLAGFGNLENVLSSASRVMLTHKLCSVKIIPPPAQEQTPKELWGDVTAQCISRAEIQNPQTFFIYCLAVTSTEDAEKGRPSSWSGAIDKLANGDGEDQRLIIISAGNISEIESWINYPHSNFVTTVHNPAQSWNAITVGAYTEKIQVQDHLYNRHLPLANEGELSPYSSTSMIWENKWPIKPDVVFEGGNLLKAPDGSVIPHYDLELLSTSKSFNRKPFDVINATSAATAHASWFAAKIAYEYPDLWPETIRGLIVHSANWHDGMFRQMNVRQGNRGDFRKLLKVFGFGVPNLERAIYSRENALTLIAQEIIQPFNFNSNNQPQTKEIHFFNFPWPKDLLLSLGEIPVKFKVTLSYFIEPGPGEIGWKDKYRYQSHGLVFDINNVGEKEEDFKKRVNLAAREEGDQIAASSGSSRWVIGTNNRNNGSIHSDYWEGTAAALSTCNLIAVYPIIGWWRERKHLQKVENRSRYALIVSLDTPDQAIELYTTVKNLIEVPVDIIV